MWDGCTWHDKTFLVELYWHLAIKLYYIVVWCKTINITNQLMVHDVKSLFVQYRFWNKTNGLKTLGTKLFLFVLFFKLYAFRNCPHTCHSTIFYHLWTCCWWRLKFLHEAENNYYTKIYNHGKSKTCDTTAFQHGQKKISYIHIIKQYC